MKSISTTLCLLFGAATLLAQGGYVFQNQTLPEANIELNTTTRRYASYTADVSNVGMGFVHTAGGGRLTGMLHNPAFLATMQNRFDVLGVQTAFPKATWDAAWFLESHIDEFTEAASLNQVWDGVNAFFAAGVTLEDRWEALGEIQEGMVFALDLLNEVSGPPDDPNRYGFSLLPGFGAQIGHWGISLYGYGQAGFMVQQSPTLDALAAVEIPENLENPVEAAQSVLQIMGIMGAALLQESQTFSHEIFPVAFYLSTVDIVGAVGYGRNVWKNIQAGANLKIINRRFSLNRIPVIEYDRIIENAFSDLSHSVTGVTLDLGLRMKLPFGTDVGLALINTVPMKKLDDAISMNFMQHEIAYKRVGDQKQVDANGDTVMIRYKRPVMLTLPFELKLPFLLNIGIHHQLTEWWSVGLDWLDLLENDNRYQTTLGRLRLGSQVTQPVWKGRLSLTGRIGFGDEHACGGFGLGIVDTVFLDGAYAWDPLIEAYSYFAQLRIVI